ncbi:MAG: rhomboid family intramembrane serine protease [Burkholderiales bacterium]|nr:rhomboid family intramembrane serine protease [Phycisphaerae bacterium]
MIFAADFFVIRRGVIVPPGHAMPLLASYGFFSFATAIGQHEFWRFFTYQFCHANIDHILLNMLSLAMIGPLVEEEMGRMRYLVFYLICGAAGPIAHLVFGQIGMMSVDIYTPLVGASASIYGVLVAAARIAPDEEVMLAFPPIDLKLRTFVIIMIGLSLGAVFWRWQNAGGHAAHIGGAVMGWFLVRRMLPINREDAMARR